MTATESAVTKSTFTAEDFAATIARCAGIEVDAQELTREEVTFAELDVDSLAVLGIVADYTNRGVRLAEGAEACLTPYDLLVLIQAAGAQEPAIDPQAPGHTVNAITIDAPFDLVWDLTNDVAGWPQLFSEYAATEILEHDGDTIRFRLTMHPDEEGRVWSWVSQRRMDRAARRATAHRVETGPFEFMDIEWNYEQTPSGVLMTWRQDFRMKPTAPVDTVGMTANINRNSLVQMQRIKGIVEAAAASARPDVPVRVVMRATIAAEDREAFEEAYRAVTARVTGTPGHVRDELLRDLADPSVYVLLAEWDSSARFFAWVGDPAHLAQAQEMYGYWADTFERAVYEVRVDPSAPESS